MGNPFSVNINAYLTAASVPATSPTIQVQLFQAPTGSSIPILSSSIVDISIVSGSPVIAIDGSATGWTEIARNQGLAKSNLNTNNSTGSKLSIDSLDNDYGFMGWELSSAQIADQAYFAIVVTVGAPTISSAITINSISLVPGDIPCRPSPQSFDEVLRECQFYYETSKSFATSLTTADTRGTTLATQNAYFVSGGNIGLYPTHFNVRYNVAKRTPPSPILYSEDGTKNSVTGIVTSGGVSQNKANIDASYATGYWNTNNFGNYGCTFPQLSISNLLTVSASVSTTNPDCYISYFFEADARLGII